jgi:hypothetical protein
MSEAIVAKIKIIQSFNFFIPTIRVETIVAPNTNYVKGGVLIGSTTNLGCGLEGVLEGKILSRSSELPTIITRIVGTPHMMFTNPIMTIYVNMIVDRPSMNSIDVGGYKNTYAKNPRGGYREPYVVIVEIPVLVLHSALFLVVHSKKYFVAT